MELNILEMKVKNIASEIFKIDIECIHSDSSPNDFSEWDSLNHINLILHLEKEFKIKFDETEIVSLVSIKTISKTIYSYL